MLYTKIKSTGQFICKRFVNLLGYDIVQFVKYPGTVPLKHKHINNCKLVENRIELLRLLPHHAICAEIGIEKGDYSQKIISITQPRKFHLIDISQKFIDATKIKFSHIQDSELEFHVGNSTDVIREFPNHYFDWVYLDTDHTYHTVKSELEAARLKVKLSGLIVLNDYIFYDHLVKSKYGVIEAVNEFCNRYNYEIVYFALHDQMFNDVVLKKITIPKNTRK